MPDERQAQKNYSVQKLSKLKGDYLSIKKDDQLFKTKDSADCFYLILDGRIDLKYNIDDNHSFSKKANKNEFFGLEELLNNGIRTNTAIAAEDTELLKLALVDYNPSRTEHTNLAGRNELIVRDGSYSTFDLSAINITEKNGIKIIRCNFPRGNLTNAVGFKNYVLSIINDGSINLVIDLRACRIVDSTFLGSLVILLKKVSAENGKLNLVCNSDIGSWLFVMTKMDNVFKIYTSLDEAVNSANS